MLIIDNNIRKAVTAKVEELPTVKMAELPLLTDTGNVAPFFAMHAMLRNKPLCTVLTAEMPCAAITMRLVNKKHHNVSNQLKLVYVLL